MAKRVLCKFFAHGACLKGELCEYSHDWKAPPNNICTFYQKGVCAYGSRCRYEHVNLCRVQSLDLSSSTDLSSGSGTLGAGINTAPSTGPFDLSSILACGEKSLNHNLLESDNLRDYSGVHPADRPICSFAAAGECPHGVNCPYIHGDLCPTCGKNCLHPLRPQEREEHVKSCEKQQKHLEALKLSEKIECGVCLERILSKTTAERKFGILSECDHSFCISCIRSWRGSSSLYGDGVSSPVRSCPMCRKISYFVIPSVIWFSSKEEKQEIIDNYKAKLRSIDCKHFNFGNANCPFGSSCFYKHTVKPGLFLSNEAESSSNVFDLQAFLEQFNNPRNPIGNEELDNDSDEDLDNIMAEVMALLLTLQDDDDDDHAYRNGRLEEVVVPHLGAEDGDTVIAKNLRLSDVLSNLQIR